MHLVAVVPPRVREQVEAFVVPGDAAAIMDTEDDEIAVEPDSGETPRGGDIAWIRPLGRPERPAEARPYW